MLRVNVGLSRKLSKDFNSTGYSINLDGEITATLNDPASIIEQVKELFDTAEEALALQIDRAQGDLAIATRDIEAQKEAEKRPEVNHNGDRSGSSPLRPANGNGQQDDPATNKQIQFLLNIGKRQGLSTSDLERRIAEIIGSPVGVYDLTKKVAAKVIDALNKSSTAEREPVRR